MPGYQNPRDMPPWVREEMGRQAAESRARMEALFRAPEAPPPPTPTPRPFDAIPLAERLAVWHSDPERAAEIRAAMVVEWGEDEVRIEEEDAILHPYRGRA